MIHPSKIFFGIPSADRRIDVDCAISTFKKFYEYGGNIYIHSGVSDLPLARNHVVKRFLKSTCDWLMMIDSDIIFGDEDWEYLWEGDEDIVTASYARKIPGAKPCDYGLGFTRVHRRVFAAINELRNENGTEMASRFYMEGETWTNFFPCGVTGDSRWLGEDRGFFTLCQLSGSSHRLEQRTRLQHVGSFIYGYPNQINGQEFFWPEEVPRDPHDSDYLSLPPVVEM